MASFEVESNNYNGFNQGISNSLWNIAIANAPYKTGNLRAQIKRIRNSEDEITIFYNSILAIYLHFLEIGAGRVKKHKKFIEEKTVGAFLWELMGFIQNPLNLSFQGIPSITLRTDASMGYERQMLGSVGMDRDLRINAFERATFSLLREQAYRGGAQQRLTAMSMENPQITNRGGRTTSNRFMMQTENERASSVRKQIEG